MNGYSPGRPSSPGGRSSTCGGTGIPDSFARLSPVAATRVAYATAPGGGRERAATLHARRRGNRYGRDTSGGRPSGMIPL